MDEMPLASPSNDTVIFITHTGERYIWPIESCRSLTAAEPLIEEAYASSANLGQVLDGDYSIRNESGAIISPSVWSSIVKPGTEIKIDLRSDRDVPPVRGDQVLFEPIGSTKSSKASTHKPGSVSEHVEAIEVEVSDQDSDVWGPNKSQSESELEYDSELSFISEGETSEHQNSPDLEEEPQRSISIPTDLEGNRISFKVNTNSGGPVSLPVRASGGDGIKVEGVASLSRGTGPENLRIAKAMSAQVEGRSLIQIHTLSGPDSPLAHSSTSLTWCHIHSERLDFTRYKEVCLGVPGLSMRLQKLIKKLLDKVEKEHVDALLDGMFIKPGTVLRGDESHQPDPQSAIFSCVPYFELQPAVKRNSATGQVNRLFPPRTLMQSYYPYEPVRERDEEQAYRKFGNENSKALIHVPNLWVLNISDRFVVTCGHQPLSKDFVKSIETIPVELTPSRKIKHGNTNPSIRLTDWTGRKLLFSTHECRSYFQMEQKLKEIESHCAWSGASTSNNSLQLAWDRGDGKKELVTPEIWSTIVRSDDRLFIDLISLNVQEAKDLKSQIAPPGTSSASPDRMSLFFQWPHASRHEQFLEKDVSESSVPIEEKRLMRCLELAEKAMLTEVLGSHSRNFTEQCFTSTEFYQKLPEETYGNIEAGVASLRLYETKHRTTLKSAAHHKIVIQAQHNMIAEEFLKFHENVRATMRLFVADLDKSIILRKLWAAMSNIRKIIVEFGQHDATDSNVDTYSQPRRGHSSRPRQAWYVRRVSSNQPIPVPAATDEFRRSIQKCRRCTQNHAYDSFQSTEGHLKKHLNSITSPPSTEAPMKVYTTPQPTVKGTTSDKKRFAKGPRPQFVNTSSMQDGIGTAIQPNLQDWIVSKEHKQFEELNRDLIAILSKASRAAQKLLDEGKDLIIGTRNEDGSMSEIYTFPQALLAGFRQTIVFYLAVERALHFTGELYKTESSQNYGWQDFLEADGLEALEKFSNGARYSLAVARNELCSMARSNRPMDEISRLSLGPEYICSWFMRRLLVRPLEKSMTVSDMYREYLSTIQFQVNHRPGKRLLRSINLLQEELIVLLEINRWQTKLISSYMQVLDDSTYEKDLPSRCAMYPYEKQLLISCLDHLSLTREDYADQIRRCGPLSESTKQSLEINEEDHGKAIMIFTIVTIIFLPLSFVTSYLGMNTSDIRDMESRQSLFWSIAIPLTAVTMGSILFISYNGDELRDAIGALYRTLAGKQDRGITARGISVAQRKRARNLASVTDTLDYGSLADEAEYMDPRANDYPFACKPPDIDDDLDIKMPYPAKQPKVTVYNTVRLDSRSPPPQRRSHLPTNKYVEEITEPAVAPVPPMVRRRVPVDWEQSTRPIRSDPLYNLPASHYRPPIPRYVLPAARYAPPAPRYIPAARAQSIPVYPHAHTQPYRNLAERHADDWYPNRERHFGETAETVGEDIPRYDWVKKRHIRRERVGGRREDYMQREEYSRHYAY